MIFLSRDPLRYKLRFLRYHWPCIVHGIRIRDWDGIKIDYLIHMARYAKR